MSNHRFMVLVLVVLLGWGWVLPAHAQTPPASLEETQARLHFIQSSLQREAHSVRVWTWSWAGFLGVATVGQLALVPLFDDEGDRIDLYFGAGSAALGLVGFLIFPLRVMHDQKDLDREITQEGPSPELLARAEERLQLGAHNEKLGRSVWAHTVNILINVALGAGLGLGFDRWESAALATGAGIIVGEVLILTQPNHLRDDLRRYQAGEWSATPAIKPISWEMSPSIGRDRYGLNLRMTF